MLYTVKKLVFRPVDVQTMDFSTQFDDERLRENLFNNLRQCMMNQIIQAIVDNGTKTRIVIDPTTIVPAPLEAHLDLFADSVQQDNYIASQVGRMDVDSPSYAKFCEVYKNHLVDVDDSNIHKGNLYKYLDGLVQGEDGAFGFNNYLTLVDEPSIKVTRVKQVGGKFDRFQYTAWFDIHFRLKKSVFDGDEDTFVIGNAVVRRVKCDVTFVPKYDGGFGLDKAMSYDVSYIVGREPYDVEYDQVIYKHDGKVRTKFVEPGKSLFTPSSEITIPSTSHNISMLTEELVSKQVESLFNHDNLKEWVLEINNDVFGSNREIVIEQKILKNQGDADGIWNIVPDGNLLKNEDIPDSVLGKVKAKSYGKTIVDGRLYTVQVDGSEKPTCIREINGGKSLNIVAQTAHKELEPIGYAYNDGRNKDTVLIARGETLVEKDAITNNFTMDTLANEKFMRFKDPRYSAVCTGELGFCVTFSTMMDTGIQKYCEDFVNKTINPDPEEVPPSQDEIERKVADL